MKGDGISIWIWCAFLCSIKSFSTYKILTFKPLNDLRKRTELLLSVLNNLFSLPFSLAQTKEYNIIIFNGIITQIVINNNI